MPLRGEILEFPKSHTADDGDFTISNAKRKEVILLGKHLLEAVHVIFRTQYFSPILLAPAMMLSTPSSTR